ncbi:MAG: ABC transporter ATP-binding protein, partial [Clostridia bacterium]|nr:ABC transporter ATP-binding protein [Clostridia bacterium]
MLEVKNVTKIYRTKGGVETRALDDVSISFGQTGLVFLLGKSGSGKSTLLNVSGGLDEPTNGEVIVKGKSSKEFTGSDFDSYRNTFVGFIFQEYNILDEFNVEDNIALALELQGKPKDREKINALLRDVELEAFAKRKPNTLSGGQKQRIAIARALVKEPQIIMADEPTGALDSATGKQVFDTLKKLSQTRLVIVVSHDREFAEIYGDRIVELQDGKIISDVTKEHVPPEQLDENVSVIGGNTLSIKSGSTLTAANMKTIQEFIKKTDGDVIITNGESEIANFKKSNRMSDSGSTETFGGTKADALADKQYTKEESKLIRSRLPAAKAIRIGASGLKLKPIRLIFTIFLSCIAFTMFGLFSTLMTYNGREVAAKSFADSGYEYINVTKKYRMETTYEYIGEGSDTYFDYNSAKFTEAEVAALADEYGSSTYGYFTPDSTVRIRNVTLNNMNNNQLEYYSANIVKFAYVPEGNNLRTLITGTYPTSADEICISSYMIEVFQCKGATFKEVTVDEKGRITGYANADSVTVNSEQDVIGKYIALELRDQEKAFKITGVFQSGEVDGKYDKFKGSEQINDFMLSMSFNKYMESESLHKLALVSENFYSEYEYAFESSAYGFYSRF